jgi:hypothetical protein
MEQGTTEDSFARTVQSPLTRRLRHPVPFIALFVLVIGGIGGALLGRQTPEPPARVVVPPVPVPAPVSVVVAPPVVEDAGVVIEVDAGVRRRKVSSHPDPLPRGERETVVAAPPAAPSVTPVLAATSST